MHPNLVIQLALERGAILMVDQDEGQTKAILAYDDDTWTAYADVWTTAVQRLAVALQHAGTWQAYLEGEGSKRRPMGVPGETR